MALPLSALAGSVSQPQRMAVPRFAASFAQPAPLHGTTIGKTNVLRFSGRGVQQAGKNGVWVSVERIPVKVGGLGEVSKTIPEAINKFSDKDLRVMVPFMDPMDAEQYDVKAMLVRPDDKGRFYLTDEHKRMLRQFLDSQGLQTYKLETAFQAMGLRLNRLGQVEGALNTPHKVSLTGDAQLHVDIRKSKITGSDCLVPFLNIEMRHRKPDGGYRSTGLVKHLVGPDGQIDAFELLQRYEPDTKTWVYAIANDKYFGRFNHLYLWEKPEEGIGRDAMFKAIMMFNRAAAAFLPELNASTPHKPGTSVHKFDGDADFIIANDWHTGPLLTELPQDYSVAKLFMLHNTFDERRNQQVVRQNRLKIPEVFARRDGRTGQPTQSLKVPYSALSLGMKYADGIIANANYVRTITLSDFAGKQQFIQYLREKLVQGKVHDMHHGLSDAYNPYHNEALRRDGYTELRDLGPDATPEARLAEMERFTKTNQRALQTQLGLYRDGENGVDNYIVMNWIARFDVGQKGFYLVMNEAEDFLRKNPNVQLVICGNGGGPRVEAWAARMRANPEFKGRIVMPGFVPALMVARINAGSDFTLLPSLYEPYGLTQLESIRLGSIPIVHGVDGLKSTVSDPAVNGHEWFHSKIKSPPEKVWEYGQTGIMMEPINVTAYRNAIFKQDAGKRLFKDEEAAIRDAQAKFRTALDRALALASDSKQACQVRENGMRYVQENHRWEPIVHRYEHAIDQVVSEHQARTASRTLAFA